VLWSRPRLPTSRPEGKPPFGARGQSTKNLHLHSSAVEVFHLAMQQGLRSAKRCLFGEHALWIERMWTQAKGRIQSKWDKFTNEDLELIAGRRERLEARIRHLYGFSPDHAIKEVDDWLRWQVVFGRRGRQRQLGSSRSALASIR
jgi:uncharacterized protein YjbJ (UPF0337 family)